MGKSIIAILVLMPATLGIIGCTQDSPGQSEAIAQTTSLAALAAVPAGAVQADARPDKVMAYYFHTTRRCRTCLGIQATIEKTIQENFLGQTGTGLLTFQSINIDQDENKHFAKDFDISFSTMIIAATKGDKAIKWEKFDGVWDYAHEPEKLTDYTIAAVQKYLEMVEKK